VAGSAYVHVVDGRLRVKVPDLKGAPAVACVMESGLRALPGVESVTASAVTGSVVVVHDPEVTEPAEILAAIRALAGLSGPAARDPTPAAPFRMGGMLAASLARVAFEAALQQAVRVFFLPVFY